MTELETMQRAKMYLDKLAQGIDPISGQEIPNDSVLNNVRLARCFFYVSGILDQVIANGGRRAAGPVCPGDAGEGRAFSGGVLWDKRTAVYSGPSDGHPAGRTIAQ